jgi:hypothetical protein
MAHPILIKLGWPWKRRRPAPPAVEAVAEVSVRRWVEIQKFKACDRHSQTGGEPFDPTCPDCVITEPLVIADVNYEPRREAP